MPEHEAVVPCHTLPLEPIVERGKAMPQHSLQSKRFLLLSAALEKGVGFRKYTLSDFFFFFFHLCSPRHHFISRLSKWNSVP